jgi:hypothetical protein
MDESRIFLASRIENFIDNKFKVIVHLARHYYRSTPWTKFSKIVCCAICYGGKSN